MLIPAKAGSATHHNYEPLTVSLNKQNLVKLYIDMRKTEIRKIEYEIQKKLCNEFISFMKNIGFNETKDNQRNFYAEMPVFYKKVSENIFLVFNIPTFDNIKQCGFHADFWRVIANSEVDFLNSKIDDKNLIDLRLSFNIDRDLSLYLKELSKY